MTAESKPNDDSTTQLTIGQCATLACLLEATAPKPGNVHRGADFEDLTFGDFAASAVAIAPAMELAFENGIGATVLSAVRATRQMVATNTNLGTILLLAPMASVSRNVELGLGIPPKLEELDVDDARQVYEAIRLANPGGLGESQSMDVNDDPPDDLLGAMKLAADRDQVARQYVDDYSGVWFVAQTIGEGNNQGWDLTTSIIHAHVRMMSEWPDSLIARKCGDEVAKKSMVLAQKVIESGEPSSDDYQRNLSDLDFWLRSDGHRRNPGTTADLIAAALFIILRDQWIKPPFK